MKKLAFLMLALLLPTLTALAAEQQVVEVGIQGMSCEFCVAKMTSKLDKLPGVEKADVSLELKRARVVMMSGQTADVERIKKAIVDTGFTPGAVKAETEGQSRH